MNASTIHPERAWQMMLAQLQMDMPKSAFNSWVRDTNFVSFEDGVFFGWHPKRVWPRVVGEPVNQHSDSPADRNSKPANTSSVHSYGSG